MKLIFRSNITPDIQIDTRGGGSGNKFIRSILEWIRPAVYSDNSFVPIAAEPYGRPTPGEGVKQINFVYVVVGIVLGLAVYGGFKLIKK